MSGVRQVRGLLGAAVVLGIVWTTLAARFLPSLDTDHPALAAVPPRVVPAQPRLARRVVLVIVDGLRMDVSRDLAFLESLRARGAGGRARAAFPTLSLAGYVTILTGVGPHASGVRTNEWAGRVAVDSLPDRVIARGGRVAFASDRTTLRPLFGLAWEQVLSPVGARTEDLLVLVPAAVDRAGHEHGGASLAYRDVARAVDQELATILRDIDLGRDAIVIVADHGHGDRGGHGDLGEDVVQVPLIIAGAGVRAGIDLGQVSLVDVAPTIAALLGIPAPGHAAGHTLIDALAITDTRRAGLVAADAERIGYLAPHLAELDAAELRRATLARRRRIPLAVVAILGMLGAAVVTVRRRWFTVERRVAVALAFPVAFAAALAALPLPLAPAHLPGDRLSFALELSPYLGIALATQVVIGAFALARATRELVLGTILVGLVAVTVPALGAWAIVGEPGATLLPSPGIVMVTPVTAAVAACQAWFAALVLAVVLVRRRASDVTR